MIDFQDDGLESQVYELIAKIRELKPYGDFPKFETKQLENGNWKCTLSIPGVKKRVSGEADTEVKSINICAMGMKLILERDYSKEQLDPTIKDSVFEPKIAEYFGEYEYNKEYLYRMIETDFMIDSDDELTKRLLTKYGMSEIEKYITQDEEIEDMADLVMLRFLVRERKKNYC